MPHTEKFDIEAENVAAFITQIEKISSRTEVKSETLDTPESTSTKSAYLKYPEPAQETEEEYIYRSKQAEYEQSKAYLSNRKLAKSINSLASQNFTNGVLAAACNFTEMADHYPRATFIANFGTLIEEELQTNPKQPSKRLASFATSYFWKEANWSHLISAVRPETTRSELLEFFTLPLNSDPGKKIVDCIPPRIIGQIVHATKDAENKTIKFDFRKEDPYLSLQEGEKLTASITDLAKQNFTNRLLTTTSYFGIISNPFNTIRSIGEFIPAIHHEMETNPDKPSPTLVTVMTESHFDDKDIKHLIGGVTPKTTKQELSEFLKVREKWSTGLRMIDYLNHHVVMEMARYLPEEDKLDIWSLKPEMITEFYAGSSLRKLSVRGREKLLSTIKDPLQKMDIHDAMDNPIIGGIHVSVGLMGGGNIDPNILDITGKFSTIRKRRICSHEDNRRFFPTHEHFRSSY